MTEIKDFIETFSDTIINIVKSFFDTIKNIKDFVTNIIIYITDFFNMFPSEIKILMITIITLSLALFIYRFIR